MITGVVSANREPIIRISVLDIHRQPHERDAILDTGFNGWLSLPPDLITVGSLILDAISLLCLSPFEI